jgi:hypothetical protein
MKTSNENRWAFKVLAGNYISEEDLEGLGISADWHLYLSPTEPPSAAQCNQQMNAYDLIACPCCGGRATIIGTLKTCEWSAICTMCGLETAHMMQPKDAALAWNRRHAPDEEGGEANTQPARGEAVGVDDPKHEAWVDFEGDFLTNGVGYAPAATYKACREAFDAAWADNASSSGRIAEARRAAKSAFDKAHPAQPASQQGAIGEIVARPYGYGVEWLVSPAPAIGTKLYASQQGEKDFEFGGYCGTCGSPCDDEGRSIHASQQAHPTGDKVRVTDEMVERMFTKARGYDCFFMFDNETLRRCVTQWLAAALDQEKGR